MKKLSRICLLLPFLLFTSSLVSCYNDWGTEKQLVGEWVYHYENYEMVEEERFIFTEDGKWSSSYYYRDIWGKNENRVDGGFFEVDFGILKLYSNYYDDVVTFDVRVSGCTLCLWNDEVEIEYRRYR
jgi:hypothetical protein